VNEPIQITLPRGDLQEVALALYADAQRHRESDRTFTASRLDSVRAIIEAQVPDLFIPTTEKEDAA
jgi:hypothetical protein